MIETIRVLVVDDSNLIREALGNFVAELPQMLVVGLARDGQEALDLWLALRPDVVLMDLRMPRLDGLAATRVLKGEVEPPAVIICTTEDDDNTLRAALDAGADAFLLKRDLGSRIEAVIWSVVTPSAADCRARN
jgi:DNA-binding NarL/FixJ family response regulator